MSRGYYVPCAPFLYLVPDSGGTPGMDCLPLQQRSPGPFHYLIHEQAKSLVALQELQNEVGALLEFRDLVMETFPHLQQKMGSSSCARSPAVSNIPVPLSSSLASTASSRRAGEWEPGRVKRKPHHKDTDVATAVSARPSKTLSQQQPKSAEASGTSSTGSSAIQDSGFSSSKEQSKEHGKGNLAIQDSGFSSSSKDKGSAQGGELDEAEDELWNLLDVIHRKGTRLREEVEHLQSRLRGDELQHDSDKDMRGGHFAPGPGTVLGADGEGEAAGLRRERDYLLDKVAEMEAETLASRVRTSELQTELGSLVAAKRDLEEQLRSAVTQKSELNSRIHDLHLQFVSGKHSSYSPLVLAPGSKRQPQASLGSVSVARAAASSSFVPVSRRASPARSRPDEVLVTDPGGRTPAPKLGALDGIVSSPSRLPRAAPDRQKVAAILQEFNPVELQRHLLTTAVHNKVLHTRLEKVCKLQVNLVEQLDKVKDENDDLRFQLEEKSIELEGTRARVRVLERLQQKPSPPPPCDEDAPRPLPLPAAEENIHHSSSTESAHDHAEAPAAVPASPKKRPSKIPLPGIKSYTAPKPPSGKTTGKSKDSPSWKSKTDTFSLSGGGKNSSWKNRSDNSNSLLSGGGKSRESPSGGRNNSSFSGRQNSRESLSGNKSRDSLSNKSRSDSMSSGKPRDASTQNSYSSNASNKKDSLPATSGRGGKGLSARRVSSATTRSGNLIVEQGGADQNSKVLTASDSLEEKLLSSSTSSLASNTNADLTDQQHGDTFSDSLNQLPDPTAFNSSTTMEPHSTTSNDNALPWHSSSSEYFDSMNNSGSVFNNASLLRSCSYFQEQYLLQSPSSTRHEGMAECCDSLENKQTDEDIVDAVNEVKNNMWVGRSTQWKQQDEQ